MVVDGSVSDGNIFVTKGCGVDIWSCSCVGWRIGRCIFTPRVWWAERAELCEVNLFIQTLAYLPTKPLHVAHLPHVHRTLLTK